MAQDHPSQDAARSGMVGAFLRLPAGVILSFLWVGACLSLVLILPLGVDLNANGIDLLAAECF